MKVEIYSDIACPWCYIGKRRFDQALSEFARADDVEVAFRPFQLDPDAPATAVPLRQHLEKRFGGGASGMLNQVSSAAAAEGISIDWDRALSVNTRTAHRLLRLAGNDYGADVQRALADRLFSMHFTHGGNVADFEQLVIEAVAVGMDEKSTREYLESGQGSAELEAEFQGSREAGVRAVPTFVFDDKWVIEGAQASAKFLETLTEVARSSAVEAAESGSAACDNGACAV